jgi:hypothetical protein
MDAELDKTHHALRWTTTEFWNQCPNVIERILFSSSDLTVGIQIADLYCYPLFHVFEYNKSQQEYWRFTDITARKLLEENSLILTPEDTKKDFRFFQ